MALISSAAARMEIPDGNARDDTHRVQEKTPSFGWQGQAQRCQSQAAGKKTEWES
jgi:hypothetical protein